MGPAHGNKADRGPTASAIQEAERTGTAQPGQEKAKGDHIYVYRYLMGGVKMIVRHYSVEMSPEVPSKVEEKEGGPQISLKSSLEKLCEYLWWWCFLIGNILTNLNSNKPNFFSQFGARQSKIHNDKN